MGYDISHALRGDVLEIIISGRSTKGNAGSIAADVMKIASTQPSELVIVDIRGLKGRLGVLDTLNLVKSHPVSNSENRHKVAVIDNKENEEFYYFHETACRNRGFKLRYFNDTGAALESLHHEEY